MSHAPSTFGIEEEFVLVDPRTLGPVDLGLEAVAQLRGSCPGVVVREFFPSQIEYATPVCTDVEGALHDLREFRTRLAAWASAAGALVAPSGTPFTTDRREPAHEGRYAAIARDIGGLTVEHQLNGLHVHVGIPDPSDGVRASNFLRPWFPVLLALAANSPFWLGQDTGFGSWRAIHSRRWTTHGVPPWFADAADYHAALERLTGVGATSDPGTINWVARLSASHPTLEVRVCDVQLDPRASVALAALIRALVELGRRSETPRAEHYEGWDAALWHAARHGTSGTLVDPASGRLVPAAAVLEALQDIVRPVLPDADARLVECFLAEHGRVGGGAQQQRRAHSRGRLAALYRDRVAG
ncbi:carboxylate-amine ligase [Microbacterium sp. PA5]|uniref:carboxylate-amine ligase n=1 Tax=Microbacterium sp. PA5 TaxID=3416654 RepID=UPI003CECA838